MARLYSSDIQAHFTILFLCVAFVAIAAGQGRKEEVVLGADLAESCKMIVQMCTAVYKSKLKGESESDKHVCLMLQSYKHCLDRSASSCTGDSPYDTLVTVVSRLLHRLCSEHNINRELETNSSLV